MDIRLALMCGIDIPIPECQLTIHQPRIKEIAFIGEKDFFLGVQSLCVNKSLFTKDESLLVNTNNFQIFMTIMSEKEAIDKKQSVLQVLSLLAPSYKINFTPRSLIFSKDGSSSLIDESNFEIFQDYIKQIFCINSGGMGDQNFNPSDEKAKEIAEKLMRGRQRVAAQKGDFNVSVLSQYLSVLTVGLNSMSFNDCMNLTVYQLYDLIERYALFINWDIDIRSRLAGGKPEDKPDNWMKSIH